MLTQGFAWACHGIAPEVLERAARAAFERRWRRVWGAGAEVTASFTPVPGQR